MPSSRSWSDVRENRASQVGNLEACWLSPRPITVRKVCTSGMNGVGEGIVGGWLEGDEDEAARMDCCIDGWKATRLAMGAKAVRNCCGLRKGLMRTIVSASYQCLNS